MSKRKKRGRQTSVGFKMFSDAGHNGGTDVGGGKRRLFPKRYQADYVKPRGGIAKDLHYNLNRSHIESLGVPDHGQQRTAWNRRGTDDRPGEPHNYHAVPETIISLEQRCADHFVIPRVEVGRLKRAVVQNNGELKTSPWHTVMLEKYGQREIKVLFYADQVYIVDDLKAVNKVAFSQRLYNCANAVRMYRTRGLHAFNMGSYEPYSGTPHSPDGESG